MNKIKIEKNLIAICMCALAIGVVTALPLTYFTPRTATAQTTDSEFGISIDYAFFSADVVDGVYQRAMGVGFTPLIDFDAFNSQTVARIEYFEFVYYTDDQELGRTYHFIGGNNSYIDHESINNFTTFSRANWFENDYERTCSGYWGPVEGVYWGPIEGAKSGYSIIVHGGTDTVRLMCGGFASVDKCDADEPLTETNSAILMALENKQTIYLDVIRAGYTTVDVNDDVVVAYTNDPIIQRLELTKNGDAYIFGNSDALENVIPGIEQILSTPRMYKNVG
ncbi:MAG: hypothetical protein LBI09_00470 [Nitrososphaerota archaeon]|jgi:hypothetical protein|nr:hypothetical protein [Nitrososphaerota archaeon]